MISNDHWTKTPHSCRSYRLELAMIASLNIRDWQRFGEEIAQASLAVHEALEDQITETAGFDRRFGVGFGAALASAEIFLKLKEDRIPIAAMRRVFLLAMEAAWDTAAKTRGRGTNDYAGTA